jgi:hypothetical protein
MWMIWASTARMNQSDDAGTRSFAMRASRSTSACNTGQLLCGTVQLQPHAVKLTENARLALVTCWR